MPDLITVTEEQVKEAFSKGCGECLEIVLDETPLRMAMIQFGFNILARNFKIAEITFP